MPGQAQLIGRRDVVARVTGLLEAGTGGVVLVGEGGIGKSRIAQEVVSVAAELGHHAVSTIATQAAAAIPLGALSHLLPDLSSEPGPMLVAARRALEAQARDRPLVIAVDDAHLLDDYSASLLLQLAMSVRSFVVATVRAGEPAPDAVVALWKDGIAERIEVGRLDPDAIADLVASVLGGQPDGDLRRAIVERSDGNPLVARELCLSGRETGDIIPRDGTWSLAGEMRASPRLVEIVMARLAGLDSDARRALDLLAHAEPLGVEVARQLLDGDVLLGLERRGLVVVRQDGRRDELWLSHPVYADVLRTAAGPLLAASLKAALADALGRTGLRRRSDRLRVATWQLESARADPELLVRAAAETYGAGDMVATARLAAGAWDRAPSAMTGVLLATALAFSRRYAEADAIFSVARTLAEDEGTRVRVTLVHAAILATGLDRPDEAMALLTELEGEVGDPVSIGMLQAQQAHLHALAGRVRDALAITEPLVTAGADMHVFVAASMAGVIAHSLAGSYETAVRIAEGAMDRGQTLWASGATSVPPEMFELEAAGARVSMGDLDALPADAPTLAIVGGVVTNRALALLSALHLATADLLRGRPRTADRRIEAVGPEDDDLLAGPAYAMRAACLAILRDVAPAAAFLARADARVGRGALFNPFLDRARAWVAMAEGRPADARQRLAAAVERALANGQLGLGLELVHLLARLGGAAVAERLAGAIEAEAVGALPTARLRHIGALAREDGPALEAVADAFRSLGADLLAAEAASQAARAFRRHDDRRRATRLERLAGQLAGACEGAITPGLASDSGALTPLTDRELEIAHLAATGLASAEIAKRLFLSPRTVDNHLQHVYQKLGVSSRQELMPALATRSEGAEEP